MSSNPNVNLHCNICDNTANLKVCSKCKAVYYCGRQHQKDDWKTHKRVCKEPQIKPQTPQVDTFDSRPFSPFPYVQKTSPVNCKLDTTRVASVAAEDLASHGLCVLDEVCAQKDIKDIVEEVKMINEKNLMKPGQLAGGKTSGRDSLKVENSSIRSDKILWLNGFEFKQFPAICRLMTDVMDLIMRNIAVHMKEKHFIEDRTKAMVACYPGGGSAYTRHVDNPSADGRLITCILYLNQDWNHETDGGVLRIFPRDFPSVYWDVEPLFNRMIFFWSDARCPHEVQPAHRDRYAVTVWYFDKEERMKAKQVEVEADVSAVRGQIAMMDVKQKEFERNLLQEQISTKAQQAVQSLSQLELENIEQLLKEHDNPREVLSFMGIGSAVQEALIEYLKSRETISQ